MRVGGVRHFYLLKKLHFVRLETLNMLVNNTINIFVMIPNIILHHVSSLNILNITNIKYH